MDLWKDQKKVRAGDKKLCKMSSRKGVHTYIRLKGMKKVKKEEWLI